MKKHLAPFLACALMAAPWANAELVDIAWGANGVFERSFVVAPGKFAEVCGALKPGESVQWRFETSAPVDFNIHYHEGDRVHEPTRADQVRVLEGALRAESAQDYCWMWSNKATAPVSLLLHLAAVSDAARRP